MDSSDIVQQMLALDQELIRQRQTATTPSSYAVAPDIYVNGATAELPAYPTQPPTNACVNAVGDEKRKMETLSYKKRIVGSRRKARLLNKRLLVGNLRRVMYESGEEIVDTDVCGIGNQTGIKLGKKVNVGIGSKDWPCRKVPTWWSRLKEDWELSQLFRHRKDDEVLNHHRETEDDGGASSSEDEHGLQDQQFAVLELKVFNAFRGLKRTIVTSPTFISYLESLENILVDYLTEWRDKATTSSPSEPLVKNVYQLDGMASLHFIEQDQQNKTQIDFRRRHPDGALFLWNLSAIHRCLTYHLSSVWGLLCHSEVVDDAASRSNRQPIHKVVILEIDFTGAPQLPVFPVSKNLISILTRRSNANRRIQYEIESDFHVGNPTTECVVPARSPATDSELV